MAALTDKLARDLRAVVPFLDALHASNTNELAATARTTLAEYERAKPGEPLTIAYIAMGAARAMDQMEGDEVERVRDGVGEDGFIDACIAHAAMIDALWESLPESVRGGFVWDYEVTEPFGERLAKHALHYGQAADEVTARDIATRLVDELKKVAR